MAGRAPVSSASPWIWGLEHSERPQFADTVCAALGAIALVLAVVVLLRGARQAPRVGLVAPGALVGVVSVAAMLTGATHAHSHDEAGHVHDEIAAAATPGADAGHVHAVDPSTWPRPFDPTQPIDFAGVPGVTPEAAGPRRDARRLHAAGPPAVRRRHQDRRPRVHVDRRRRQRVRALHQLRLHRDERRFLHPNKPESLVYQVDGDKRTLVAAMFRGQRDVPHRSQARRLGGPLMQWHVHDDLCWSLDANRHPVVVGDKGAAGNCPAGSISALGDIPMVHVWITPNECGPFAALEGHGAGQVAGDGPRVDQCAAHHQRRGLTVVSANFSVKRPATVALTDKLERTRYSPTVAGTRTGLVGACFGRIVTAALASLIMRGRAAGPGQRTRPHPSRSGSEPA